MSSRVLRLTFAVLVLAFGPWTGSGGSYGASVSDEAAQDPPAAQAPPAQRPLPPDQQAWRAANRSTDPAERLAALRKVRDEYPQSSFKPQIDTAILTILANTYPERHDELERQFDLVLGHIVPSDPPQKRLAATQTAVMILLERVTHKPLLERAARVLSEAVAAVDLEQFIEAGRASAKAAKDPEPSTGSLERKFDVTRAQAWAVLGRLQMARGETVLAEAEFRRAIAITPALPMAVFALADIEEKRGNQQAALAWYLHGAATGRGRAAHYEALRRLYNKVHGSLEGLDDAVDAVYRNKFPNPVKPDSYVATSARSNRVVLFELFTGSSCFPCVAADLALEGVLARYPQDAVAVLAYHGNLPQPDPMVVSAGRARGASYKVGGIPAHFVDGAGKDDGWGDTDRSPEVYRRFTTDIDKALEVPAQAKLAVTASTDGRSVRARITVSAVPPEAAARLHVVLAERQLRFSGENGVRFHPMVVRAVAGENATGFPVPAPDTTIEHTFDFAAIQHDIRKSLADTIAERFKAEPGGAAAPNWRAEGNAMVEIDPAALVVVAFVQGADQRVLQAVRTDVRRETPGRR